MYKNAILVLLYNKKVVESSTLNSLKKSLVQYPVAKLVIWNNGPTLLSDTSVNEFENLAYEVEVKETISNESLAVIYNQFLANNPAEKYILIDDDSILNPEYILASSKISPEGVGMPIISSLGKVEFPLINGQPYSEKVEINSKSKVFTIGSGLVIGKGVVETLIKTFGYVFDERFYLYGVDTTFCYRLLNNALTDRIQVISGFNHSLSRLESENVNVTKFRKLERSYDIGLQLKYYYSPPKALWYLLRVWISSFKQILLKKPPTFKLFALWRAFYSGKHYRKPD
jgi:hypothetical protein